MAPIKPCIFSPKEIQAVLAGSQREFDLLKQWSCSSLRQVSLDQLRHQFLAMAATTCFPIAYLWSGKSTEAICTSDQNHQLNCKQHAAQQRCEAVKAALHGQLSEMTAAAEKKFLGHSKCQWQAALKRQNQAWVQYYETYKSILNFSSLYSRLHLTLSFLLTGERIPQVDLRLLGALKLLASFLEPLHLKSNGSDTMQDMLCSRHADCNIISTRVLDLLQMVGELDARKVQVAHMPNHLSISVLMEKGVSLYFDNGQNFLRENQLPTPIQINPFWQIMASNYGDIGSKLTTAGRYRAAIAVCKQVLQIDPHNMGAYYKWGATLVDMGDYEGAIAKYRMALEYNPNDAGTHYNLGNVLLKQGNVNAAIDFYMAAIRLDPELAVAYGNLGAAWAMKGNVDAAIVAFLKSAELDPNDISTHMNLGFLYSNKGNLDAAIAEYQRALSLNPKNRLVRRNLRDALKKKENSR